MTSEQGALRPAVTPDDHIIGEADAPVTLVEYGDFQCPHCERAHRMVLPKVRSALGSKLRYVFRNFPLTEAHPNALHAAEAAESVAALAGKDAYWTMHDTIFDHQRDGEDALDDEHLLEYAAGAGASADDVARDLDEETYEPRVKADFMSGVRSGVNGTPTFFINGRRFEGDWTVASSLTAALEEAAR